jgi:hypothetical protein
MTESQSMSLNVRRRPWKELKQVHHERGLALRLERGEAIAVSALCPQNKDEPSYIRFSGRVGVRTADGYIEGPAKLTVTRLRLIMMLEGRRSGNPKGLDRKIDEVAFVSVLRSDLAPPTLARTILGKVKRAEFSGTTAPFTIRMLVCNRFEQFLKTMAPEYASELGHDTALRVHQEEQRKVAAEREAEAAAKREQSQSNAARFNPAHSSRSRPTLGVFDHRKTWRFRVGARPEQCVDRFLAAFTGSGGLLLKAKWEIAREGPEAAVATYQGRRGVVVLGTIMSTRVQSEEESAIGSEVRFEVEESDSEHTVCAMWLAASSQIIGFTMEGRFFRPYMRAVEDQLRAIDPEVKTVKD